MCVFFYFTGSGKTQNSFTDNNDAVSSTFLMGIQGLQEHWGRIAFCGQCVIYNQNTDIFLRE